MAGRSEDEDDRDRRIRTAFSRRFRQEIGVHEEDRRY